MLQVANPLGICSSLLGIGFIELGSASSSNVLKKSKQTDPRSQAMETLRKAHWGARLHSSLAMVRTTFCLHLQCLSTTAPVSSGKSFSTKRSGRSCWQFSVSIYPVACHPDTGPASSATCGCPCLGSRGSRSYVGFQWSESESAVF